MLLKCEKYLMTNFSRYNVMLNRFPFSGVAAIRSCIKVLQKVVEDFLYSCINFPNLK